MARDAAEWQRVLCECGVHPATAQRWASVFADEIGDDTFNKGDREVPLFVPQVLHESGMLERLTENLNYSAGRISEIGMTFKPGTRWRAAVPKAIELARNPRAFAEHMYGGRYGNTQPGDGYKYRGRGLMQITFRDNYRRIGELIGQDLVEMPELLEQPHYALQAAIAIWEADVPDSAIDTEDVGDETQAINGGQMGKRERQLLADLCMRVMA